MSGSTYEHPAAHPPPPKRPLDDVRAAAALGRAKPAYAAGIRAGLATVVPLLVDHAFHTGGGAWMSLAGLNGGLLDRGGSYRARAIVLAALAAAGAAVAFLGAVLAGHPVLAVPATFVVALVCGVMRVWPDAGPAFGVTTLVTFAIALAVPAPSVGAAAARAGFVAIGGAWALLISIVVWPLRPYRPVRRAVARCYRAIADYLEHVATQTTPAGSIDPWAFRTDLTIVRETLETARRVLAATRRGRGGETSRGERLLMLHELADQVYVHVIALASILEGARASSIPAAVRDALAATGQRAAATLRTIADGIESERDLPRADAAWSGDAFRAAPLGDDATPAAVANRAQLAALVDRVADYASVAAAFTATLNRGGTVAGVDDRVDLHPGPQANAALLSISALARPDSVVLRHALRIATVTTIAVIVTTLLHLNHGYWVTLTVVVIMQPYVGATRQKALQRVAGTIVGALVAAAINMAFTGSVVIVGFVFLFTSLCVALLPVNYGAYAVFGTPAFVLLAEASVAGSRLAGLRVIDTLIGGALALVGSRLLWPVDEWNRVPEYVAQAISGCAEFLRRAVVVSRSGARSFGALRDVRRSIALAAANAEDSFQRLLGDREGASVELEPIMATLVYTRRLAAAIAGLAVASGIESAPNAEVDRFADAAALTLDDLANAIASGRAASPIASDLSPPPAPGAAASSLHARARRIARQVTLLHDAVDRWMSAVDARRNQ